MKTIWTLDLGGEPTEQSTPVMKAWGLSVALPNPPLRLQLAQGSEHKRLPGQRQRDQRQADQRQRDSRQ